MFMYFFTYDICEIIFTAHLKGWYSNRRIHLNLISRDYLMECVERDYVIEKKAAAKEFEEKKIELRETLITDMEEKRKLIESERHTMELTGDSMEVSCCYS